VNVVEHRPTATPKPFNSVSKHDEQRTAAFRLHRSGHVVGEVLLHASSQQKN
jgi:hypothetical protein